MSIQFSCLKCLTNFTVDDREAGKWSKCKKCGQSIQVPVSDRSRTVLGVVTEPSTPERSKTILGELPPITSQDQSSAVIPVPLLPVATRLPDVDPRARSPLPPPRSYPSPRRSNKNKPIAIILFGSVALIIVGVLLILLIASGKKPDTPPTQKEGTEAAKQSPKPDIEGDQWSIEDMGKYLKSRGMDSISLNYVRTEDRSKTLSFYRFAPSATREHLLESKPHELRHAVEVITTPDPWPKPVDLKDAASRMNVEYPGTAFAWGRFLFRGDGAYISKIKAALK